MGTSPPPFASTQECLSIHRHIPPLSSLSSVCSLLQAPQMENHQQQQQQVAMGAGFEDHLPTMAGRLGGQGLVEELCNGFQLLMDPREGVITFESLKRNAEFLGLQGMGDNELMGMLREGDLNGDGVLDQMEFCILMFRLSPELMDESRRVLGETMGVEE